MSPQSSSIGSVRPPTTWPMARIETSGNEVLGLGVVEDQRGGGLFGLVLERRLFAALDTDLLCVEQLVDLDVVFEVRAGGVAERVAAAAVLLAEQPGDAGTVLFGEAPLLTHAAVPQLGEC